LILDFYRDKLTETAIYYLGIFIIMTTWRLLGEGLKKCRQYSFTISEANGLQILQEILSDHDHQKEATLFTTAQPPF